MKWSVSNIEILSCNEFLEEFDAPIGPSWDNSGFAVDSGSAIGGCGSEHSLFRTVATGTGGEFIEAQVSEIFQVDEIIGVIADLTVVLTVINRYNPVTGTARVAQATVYWTGVFLSYVSHVQFSMWSIDTDASIVDLSSTTIDGAGGPGTDLGLRLESYNGGRQVLYGNGTLMLDSISTTDIGPAGQFQGVKLSYTCAGADPVRLNFVEGGCL